MARRRRSPGSRRYSLADLLAKQPKSLQKHDYYQSLLAHYYSSERLKGLRVSQRCYTLLHTCRIRPEHLKEFYRTYRLPRDPFFPLFFRIKRDYLEQRRRQEEARRTYIHAQVRRLPAPILSSIYPWDGLCSLSFARSSKAPLGDSWSGRSSGVFASPSVSGFTHGENSHSPTPFGTCSLSPAV